MTVKFLGKLIGKKIGKKVVGARKADVISDAETVLAILRGSLNHSSMEFDELKQHFYRHKGLLCEGEKRILDAIGLLARSGIIGWGGSRGNSICFMKRQLPSRLPIIKFEGDS